MRLLTIAVVIGAMSLGATSAQAEQCAAVNAKIAAKASKLLKKGTRFVSFCPPCGETAPGDVQVVSSVKVTPFDDMRQVEVNGEAVDLAYTFAAIGDDGAMRNVALAAGCEASDVPAVLSAARVAPRKAMAVRKDILVEGANDEWTDTGLRLEEGDLVLVSSAGAVTLGGWADRTVQPDSWCKPSGSAEGALNMKIGATFTQKVEPNMVHPVEQSGALKFRVGDSKYSDNSGQYYVSVIVVSKDVEPAVQQLIVAGENDEWEPAGEVGDELVMVVSSGIVGLGGFTDMSVAPNGVAENKATPCGATDTNGVLEMKVGRKRYLPGRAWFAQPGAIGGPLRFRVKDSDFTDNSGQFWVSVVRIPADAIVVAD